MSFLRKIFGGGDPLARLRRAVGQREWAEALAVGSGMERDDLPPDARAELDSLLKVAGDGLAELNISEGEACLRAGDRARAGEHFSLAAAQACTEELRQRAEAAVAGLKTASSSAPPQPVIVPIPPSSTAASDCHTGCTTGCAAPSSTDPGPASPTDLDPKVRFELILASYPPVLAERYLQLSESFRSAFLLAHEGREGEALSAFESVPREQRSDLFHFERGALCARLGDLPRALADLERALELNPDHLLALETLVQVELASGNEDAAEKRLQLMLSRRLEPAFCHGTLAAILARRGDFHGALDHGLQAVSSGEAAPETLQLTASLLEHAGRIAEAERVLMMLAGGGCSGGPNPSLAEFWLRHGKNHDKALESFKAALRVEPGNPRWLLRVAQVYLARGWEREGMDLLEKVMANPDLEQTLRAEGEGLLASCRR